jgi:hypothetical protein
MVKKIVVVLVIVILVIVAVVLFSMRGPDVKKFEYLQEPQITKMENQKMMAIEVKGDPEIVSGSAISQLFRSFYGLKRDVKGIKMIALRSRWSVSPNMPKDKWVGVYGLVIPNTVENLSVEKGVQKPLVKIDTWKYGDIAEILHIGPYSEEMPTVEKLMSFIKSKGYRAIGEHEEEYIKGPGMFFKGDPKKYYTIIRYRIVKK